VTDPSELAHRALLSVAAFLKTLPADQLADLASGAAKLELVPKGGRRPTGARAATGSADLPRPAPDIARTLNEIGDRTAAGQYLVDLKMTIPKLKALATELGITVGGTKQKHIDSIVEWAVGRRLDADAISRVGTAR